MDETLNSTTHSHDGSNHRSDFQNGRTNFVLDTARGAHDYHRRGWSPTPLQGKKPIIPNWQSTRYTETELEGAFPDGANVGVVLGQASSGLADVDLDCAEARSLASTFLPPTRAKFGRDSSPRSHWLYNVSPWSFKTERLADPDNEVSTSGDHKGALVELRGDNSQTMMPPSVHPCGESVRWESDLDAAVPAPVTFDELQKAVRKVAAGSLLARRWKKLPRHDATLAMAGALLQGGLSAEDTEQFVLVVADDDEPDDRRRAVEDTIKKFAAGLPIAGAAKCKELFGDRVWSKVVEWLGLRTAGGD